MQELERLCQQAQSAARAAGSMIREAHLKGGIEVDYKGPCNPVTAVDHESQRMIREHLLSHNPEHEFWGEEDREVNRFQGEHLWIVDPLDGTKNFAHGYPHFAVSIALEMRGQVVLGVIHDPMRQETFSCIRGGGAFLNGRPIQVSEISQLEDALFATGFAGGSKLEYEIFLCLERPSHGVRRDGSAALNLAYVACGRVDGVFQLNLSPWDVAAGALLVSEAQGMVTDYSGGHFHCRNTQVVASNVKMHRAILVEIEPFLPQIQRRFPSGYR